MPHPIKVSNPIFIFIRFFAIVSIHNTQHTVAFCHPKPGLVLLKISRLLCILTFYLIMFFNIILWSFVCGCMCVKMNPLHASFISFHNTWPLIQIQSSEFSAKKSFTALDTFYIEDMLFYTTERDKEEEMANNRNPCSHQWKHIHIYLFIKYLLEKFVIQNV